MMKSVPPTNKEERKRGRPTGKNRIPLSKEERRARNAQYERERRNETTVVMTELAQAALCDPDISHAELLARVIRRLQKAANRKPDEIENLKRINENLESQIAMLQNRLGNDVNIDEDELIESNVEQQSDSESSCNNSSNDVRITRSRKYRKISAKSSIHDRIRFESSSSDWSEENNTTEQSNEKVSPEHMDASHFASDITDNTPTVSTSGKQYYEQNHTEVSYQNHVKLENDYKEDLIEPLPASDDMLGPLTKEERDIISEWLNDRDLIQMGIEASEQLFNWPENVDDVFSQC